MSTTLTNLRPTTDDRRRCAHWPRPARLLLRAALVLLLIAGSGALYEAIGAARDRVMLPPPGRMVDVGGYRLHLFCEGSGGPTVVLDHVGAGNAAQWGLVQPALAADVRVCAYDRAGFGWSEAGPAPRDGLRSARELHALLAGAGERGPFVLVGHSYGANVARLFAASYPEQTAGVVLLDPGTILDDPRVPAAVNERWTNEDATIIKAGPLLASFGVARLAHLLGMDGGTGDLPPAQAAAFGTLAISQKHWQAVRAQYDAWPETSAEVLAAGDLGDLPLAVLSSDHPNDEAGRAWGAQQERAARLSRRGSRQVVPGSTHMGLALDKTAARATVAAIRRVLAQARAGGS